MTTKFDVIAIGTGSAASAVVSRCRDAGWPSPFLPPLAAVGLDERGAREQHLEFRVNKEMTSTWYSSRRVAETHSGYKVLVEKGTDRILGAHILGSEAAEVINLFALAIRSRMRATDLRHMLFAYPTSGSNVTRML